MWRVNPNGRGVVDVKYEFLSLNWNAEALGMPTTTAERLINVRRVKFDALGREAFLHPFPCSNIAQLDNMPTIEPAQYPIVAPISIGNGHLWA